MEQQQHDSYLSSRGRGRGRGRPAPAFRKKQETSAVPNGLAPKPKVAMEEENWAKGPPTRRGTRGRGHTLQGDSHSDLLKAEPTALNGTPKEDQKTEEANKVPTSDAKAKEVKKEKPKTRKVAAAFTASADPNFSWFADPNGQAYGTMDPATIPCVVQQYPAPAATRPQVSFADDKVVGLDLSQIKLTPLESPDRARKGFLNTSISCYMNVVLQSLLACPPFYNLLLQLSRLVAPQPSLKTSSSSFIKCFAELVRYFDVDTQNTYGIYQRAVVEAESIFSAIVGKFNLTCEQQDCQEFLCYLLDGLHREFLSISKEDKKKAEEKEEDEGSEDEWTEMGEKGKVIIHNNAETGSMEKSFVTDIFGGLFKSELTAHGKSHATATYEPFYLISLDISEVENVARAFDSFFKEEELNDYLDEVTKEKVKATHRQTIELLPEILIIHLKRFVYSVTAGVVRKLQGTIKYDPTLTINEAFVSPKVRLQNQGRPMVYQLIGVISHTGKTAARGHYTCCTMDCNNKWEYYDDRQHNPISPKDALYMQPYVLLYQRLKA